MVEEIGHDTDSSRKESAEPSRAGILRVEFNEGIAFQQELQRRVEDFFRSTGRMENPWMVHQVQVTVNFARGNRVLIWLLGGLNYHKEHHLFPLICHVNYPGLSKVVEQTCRDFGIPYKEHKSFRAGLASHYRWLRRMGTAD